MIPETTALFSCGVCLAFFFLGIGPSLGARDCEPVLSLEGNGSGRSLPQSPLVEVVLNSTTLSKLGDNATLFSILVVNCSASYPIQWTFLHHPHHLNESGVNNSSAASIALDFGWNVSHTRIKEDILDEVGGESWMALLTFVNISRESLQAFVRPECTSVSDPCLATDIPGLGEQGRKLDGFPPETGNCSVDLWFDEASVGHFLCKNKENAATAVAPSLSFRYCSNPTECGVVGSRDSECWEHGGHTHPKGCDGTKGCASLRVGSEFPIPKVISCEGQEGSGAKLLGYFHSLKEVGGRPASSYVSWEEADPSDLVSLTPSKSRVMANESFDLECGASSYYFAGGMHLTIKSLSGGSASYSEAELGPSKRLNDTRESIELWVPRSGSGQKNRTGIPLRRTILARDLILAPGEYEITCYAPVWNSTQWATKTALIAVSRISLPVFLTGNGTITMPFTPRHNISCLARGIPPPKITWTYRPARVQEQVVEVLGSSKEMSWSLLTLPASVDASGSELEFKCRAENSAGWTEKLFLITRIDESFLVSTKIAATVVLLGFVGNLIVFFFCWKKLFAEVEDEEDEERKELAGIKFLRALWNARHFSWCRCKCAKNSSEDLENNACSHPKCRQKQGQATEL